MLARELGRGPVLTHPKIFISYSHKDKRWLERLRVHLKPIERESAIELWDDTKIAVGEQWKDTIWQALEAAQVAVLRAPSCPRSSVGTHFLRRSSVAVAPERVVPSQSLSPRRGLQGSGGPRLSRATTGRSPRRRGSRRLGRRSVSSCEQGYALLPPSICR